MPPIRETLDRLRGELLDARTADGHWTGRLSSSALSTATAVSALSAVLRECGDKYELPVRQQMHTAVQAGIQSLAKQQNDDGGFGDTDRSRSNIATTYLVLAASELATQAGQTGLSPNMLHAANDSIERSGAIDGLRRRYGRDKTFVVPILCNLAIAGKIDWRKVPALPFELAALPASFYAAVRMPVVSYAVPALVAIGQARHVARPSRFWPLRWIRILTKRRTMAVLEHMQPKSGGYLEATPLTSFVLMSLAASRRGTHVVARRGVEFLLASIRDDGSWPIDTNLAVWVTSLAIEALSADPDDDGLWKTDSLRDWHRGCQYELVHPFTSSPPGGWAWTDLSGGVPDGDDTPAAILATRQLTPADDRRGRDSIGAGQSWLSKLQNRDGGVPTFCRGWGRLPFDRSSVDLTAHALRSGGINEKSAVAFLIRHQQDDGSWLPLWFGNQDRADEDNPVYGTSRVLMAAKWLPESVVDRGLQYLLTHQNPDDGWGGGESIAAIYGDETAFSSVEETALAVEAIVLASQYRGLRNRYADAQIDSAIIRGSRWLAGAVDRDWHRRATPIGFYFAKLWYYEDLYPTVMAARALASVQQRLRNGEFSDSSH